jgi:hypothetical protein
VKYRQGPVGDQSRVYAMIKHLIGSTLKELNVACDTNAPPIIQPVSDNFLPSLGASTNLRVLQVHARIDEATSVDLATVVEKCQKLKVVRLNKYTGFLIDEKVMGALVRHSAIEELNLEKWIDGPLGLAVVNTPRPFRYLLKLMLRASPHAASMVLPQLHLLETLDLLVIGTKSLFPSISSLTSLRSLAEDPLERCQQ